MYEDILGIVYTFCFATCLWPQIIKSIKRKTVGDISIVSFYLTVIGYLSAIGYTLLKVGFDFWWLLNYTASLFGALVMIFIYFKFKR